MIRAALLSLVAVLCLAAPATADIPQPGPDPYSTDHWYDRDGSRYFCLDTDVDLGCLYQVDSLDDEFVLYWVGNDGMRRSYRIPKSGWAAMDGQLFYSESYDGFYRIEFRRADWFLKGFYDHPDPTARPAEAYPCCPDGSC